MNDLYIYYQVPDVHAQSLAPRILAMQARLAELHAVSGQLKRRPDSKDGMQTWMEIYPATHPGFDAALAFAVQDAAVSDLIHGPRHTEVFSDISTCA